MIVRLMGEAQFEAPDDLQSELNELDDEAVAAVEAADEGRLRSVLERMAQLVRDRGTRLPDEDLHASDLLVPPADLSLDEARELFSGDGLIPDLPGA
jgi:hypothetical protein